MKRDLDYFLNKTKDNNGCLEWTGCYNTDGYPRVFWKGSANGKLHRIIYELTHKKPATGLVIRHTCDNPKCINPKHLICGTQQDNMQDRVSRDRTFGLKQPDVDAIKLLYNSKTYSAKELSLLYQVSLRTIYYTLNNRK